jgi:hypothetical protein
VAVLATFVVAPTASAAGVAGFEVAVHGVNGNVGYVGVDGVGVDLHVAMAPDASPTIAGLSTGGAAIEYTQSNGFLGRYRDGFGITTDASGQTVLAGTRPALASNNAGGTQTVFLDGSRFLERRDGDVPAGSTGIQVATGTSPSIAFGGSTPRIALAGTDGLLYELTGPSTLTKIAGGISAKAGTSPAIAALGSGREIAFVGTDGDLYLFDEFHGTLTHIAEAAVLPGTNPAIASDGRGGFLVAVVNAGSLHALQVVTADHQVTTVTNLSVAGGTSPSIASAGSLGWRVAVTDTGNHLATYDSDGTIAHTAAVAAAGTSPAIAYVTPVPAPTPTPTGTATPPPVTATLTLSAQSPGSGLFVPFAGRYPAFGSVAPFHLVGVRFPLDGFVDQVLAFVKPGHSTAECGNADAVITVAEGASLTSAQLMTLYGSAQPHFTTLNPLSAVACWNGSGQIPGVINLQITIQND